MLIAKDITMKFGNKLLFEGFNYEFEKNKIYCILGKSGCGKTTLLRIFAGLQKPTRGLIQLGDTIVDSSDPSIFMMHQQYTNFPWMTCYENIVLPLKITHKHGDMDKKTIISALEAVGLENCIDKYPYELSNGMQQRLALARTMICEPPVILMDEPLSALDPKTRSNMQDLILDFHYRTRNTIIMVTHDHDEARKLSDKIINL